MAIGIKAQKTLWGRAAGRCSIPECRKYLFEDDETAGDPTLVGENCHIVSDADKGPRAEVSMSQAERDSYPNLILCCRNHHKVIDAQVETYTVEALQKIKRDHEEWVLDSLDVDQDRLYAEECYAAYIEIWEQLAHIDSWDKWSSWILGSGQPAIHSDIDADLFKLRQWFVGRVWPRRYTALEQAFTNFHTVLNDMQETFHNHMVKRGDMMWTRKFYQIEEWDEERYARLSRKFNHHVDLVQDLMFELTRAGNLICDRVRETMLRNYRVVEGHLVVESGPDMTMTWTRTTIFYSEDEAARSQPYPGLEAFQMERTQRDRYYGEGKAPID